MEEISPQLVALEFVKQYYTLLNKAPLHLHRFYSGDSSFVHGGLDKGEKMQPVHGQQEIHKKIMQLNFRDCKAKIKQVDAHATLASGVVVQVLGELSNNNKPMRRFMQTFVLAPQTPKKYYVYNDIFRYQDEVFKDDLDTNASMVSSSNNASSGTPVTETPNVTSLENEKNFHASVPNDGIATVSIIDGVQKEPHLNGGGSSGAMSVNELSPRVPVEVPPSAVADESLDDPIDEDEDPIKDPEDEPMTPTATPINPVPPIAQVAPISAPAPVEIPPLEEPPTPKQHSVPAEAMIPTAPLASNSTPVVSVGPVSNVTPAEASNEKPTYANLFKKSGGPMVATAGPISLPPAGFNKAASSQPTSTSATAALSPSAATVAPVTPGATGASATTVQAASTTGGGGHIKENSPAAFTAGKPYRGGGGSRSGGRGGGFSGGNPSASRDRYHPSRESVSSAMGDDAPSGSSGLAADRDRGRSSRMGMNALSQYPDSQQVFVGNLPHHCQEKELEDLFSKFGKVIDVRINQKGVTQTKSLSDNSQKSVPNFGFVVFEDEKSAHECLQHKPINLLNGHRLNVEAKKKNFQNRDDGKGAFGGSGGGSSRGQGAGSNFDRGSQEQLGGLGRGGLNTNSGRGGSRGGIRGGRGGFSGGRGGGNSGGPPSQGPMGGPGNPNSQRTQYTRRS